MATHIHYQSAYRAYINFSFSPEKRAKQECEFFDEIMLEISAMEDAEAKQLRFEKLLLASLSAKSRCASPMITGGARFPVDRNRKAMESDHKRTCELLSYIEKLRRPPMVKKAIKPRTDITTKEVNWNGVRVVQNAEENRLQLFFEGKPSADKITLLKSRAFKWSPTRGCWQRQMTNNAIYAAQAVCA